MPDPMTEYMRFILDLIEANAYYFARIEDWPALRQQFMAESAHTQSTLDLYPLVDDLLGHLHDHHSHLRRPQPRAIMSANRTHSPMPHAALIKQRWGYLNLPDCAGGDELTQAYADIGRKALNQFPDVEGWVIDLRQNTGGNMWPMLATIGPLAATEVLGKFVNRDGNADSWSYRSGATYYNDNRVLQSQVTVEPISSTVPVAVLLGKRTASSGEITAISLFGRPHTRTFGQPTRGVPTANVDFELSDGALLLLTTALTGDRSGQLYDAALIPDEITRSTHAAPRTVIAWLSKSQN